MRADPARPLALTGIVVRQNSDRTYFCAVGVDPASYDHVPMWYGLSAIRPETFVVEATLAAETILSELAPGTLFTDQQRHDEWGLLAIRSTGRLRATILRLRDAIGNLAHYGKEHRSIPPLRIVYSSQPLPDWAANAAARSRPRVSEPVTADPTAALPDRSWPPATSPAEVEALLRLSATWPTSRLTIKALAAWSKVVRDVEIDAQLSFMNKTIAATAPSCSSSAGPVTWPCVLLIDRAFYAWHKAIFAVAHPSPCEPAAELKRAGENRQKG